VGHGMPGKGCMRTGSRACLHMNPRLHT
jgi:hypothetical protein